MPRQSEKADFAKFILDVGANAIVDGPTVTQGYTRGGNLCLADHPEALARFTADHATGSRHYHLKRASQGPEAGRLWNPHSPTYDDRSNLAFHHHLGRYQYDWCKVTAEQFELYLTFLRTDDIRHLRHAERE